MGSVTKFSHLPQEVKDIIWAPSLEAFTDPPALLYFTGQYMFYAPNSTSALDDTAHRRAYVPVAEMPAAWHMDSSGRKTVISWAARAPNVEMRMVNGNFVLFREWQPLEDVLYLADIPKHDLDVDNVYSNVDDLPIMHVALPDYEDFSHPYVASVLAGIPFLRTVYIIWDSPSPQPVQEHQVRWDLHPIPKDQPPLELVEPDDMEKYVDDANFLMWTRGIKDVVCKQLPSDCFDFFTEECFFEFVACRATKQ